MLSPIAQWRGKPPVGHSDSGSPTTHFGGHAGSLDAAASVGASRVLGSFGWLEPERHHHVDWLRSSDAGAAKASAEVVAAEHLLRQAGSLRWRSCVRDDGFGRSTPGAAVTWRLGASVLGWSITQLERFTSRQLRLVRGHCDGSASVGWMRCQSRQRFGEGRQGAGCVAILSGVLRHCRGLRGFGLAIEWSLRAKLNRSGNE